MWMWMLTHSRSKCFDSIVRLNVDCGLQGHPAFTRENSNHSQNRRYRQFVLTFGGVCASLHVLRLRFITDVQSVRSMGLGVLFMAQSHRLLHSTASPT